MTGVHFKESDIDVIILRFLSLLFQKITISSNIIKKKLAKVTKMLMISARWYNQYARYQKMLNMIYVNIMIRSFVYSSDKQL